MYNIFLDISGSVDKSNHYWNTVNDIYNNYKNEIDGYYVWDNGPKKIRETIFQNYIKNKTGYGGTEPSQIIKYIKTKEPEIKNIILITDGDVGDKEVSYMDDMMKDIKFDKVVCYIIANEYSSRLNLSVTCPFTRNCEAEVYTKYNGKEMEQKISLTKKDFEILENIENMTLDNFDTQYNLIESLIIAKNMGKTGDENLKNKILQMKKRLFHELSNKLSNGNQSMNIRSLLEKNDIKTALDEIKKITDDYFGESITNILDKKINYLISLCGNLQGKYNIDEIKSNRIKLAENVKEVETINEIEVNDLTSNPIECPVLYDTDIPQILINDGEPVLLGLDKKIVEDIGNCPLRILNYKEVLDKLKTRISNYIGVKYTEYLKKNPFTTQELLGTIPLGMCKEHVNVGNYTISRLFTGGKLFGNMNMYFAVIWYLINKDKYEYLSDIKKNMDEHMKYRLINSTTSISLCGLSQFVSTKTTSDVAVWYVVNSGWLQQPTDRDTLRYHIFNIEPLIEMVNLLGYPIEENAMNYIYLTQIMMKMLNNIKHMNSNEKLEFYNLINGLYQNGVYINTDNIGDDVKQYEKIVSFVPIDGKTNNEIIFNNMNKLSKNEKTFELFNKVLINDIIYIGKMIDSNKSASDIIIPYEFNDNEYKHIIEWSYGLNYYPNTIIPISKKTLRPYYIHDNKTWKENFQNEFKFDSDKCMKGCKYFMAFVVDYKRKPNIDEYIIYLYNRYIINGSYKTLPYQIIEFSKDIIESYKDIDITEDNYKKMVKIYNDSVSIESRKELEK